MKKKPLNQRTVTIKLPRGNVWDLIMACDLMTIDAADGKAYTRWRSLREELKAQVSAFDESQRNDTY